MKDFFERVISYILDFFNLSEIKGGLESQDSALPLVMLSAFIVTNVLFVYEQSTFAYSGRYGAVGMGIILFLAWATVIVALALKIRIRAFVLTGLITSAVFIYLVPQNMSYAREHGDMELQEVIKATGQKTN